MGKAKINYRLYASLLVMGLCPAIYQAVRIFFLGQMPDPGAYSIAGQLSWVQLLYEIVQETVLLPLYLFLGQVVSDNWAGQDQLYPGPVGGDKRRVLRRRLPSVPGGHLGSDA